MAKGKKKAESRSEQSARFVRAATEAGVDNSGKQFERVFKQIVVKRATRPSKPR